MISNSDTEHPEPGRHAYLIIAHNKFEQLQLLINLLDDERNDIFVHIDKKAGELPALTGGQKSKLTVLDRRLDIRWGDVSQIRTELLLFETAYNNGPYRYYHLLSGVDLPIKTNIYIHEFFEQNDGKEFVGYLNVNPDLIRERVCRYHCLTRFYRQSGSLLYHIRKTLEDIVNLFVKRKEDNEFKKGANWVSITNDFCKYLLLNKKYILKRYKHTCLCDEIFIQTLLWNSPFKENIYRLDDEYEGCMRLIDWNRGGPYVWGEYLEDDKKLISSSTGLFARKFDMDKYPEIVNFVVNMTNPKKKR